MNRFSPQFVAFALSTLVVLSFSPDLAQADDGIAASDVLILMNQDREKAGLPSLFWNDALSQAAEMRLNDMEMNGYFAHVSPSGEEPWSAFEKSGYRYRYAGENLAIHFTDADSEETAWMTSKEHRDNILNPRYRESGVAVREINWKGNRTLLAVVLFGTRVGESSTLSATLPSSFSRTAPQPTVAGLSQASSEANVVSPAVAMMPDRQTVAQPQSPLLSMPVSSLSYRFWMNILLSVVGITEIALVALIFRAYFFSASLPKIHHRMYRM